MDDDQMSMNIDLEDDDDNNNNNNKNNVDGFLEEEVEVLDNSFSSHSIYSGFTRKILLGRFSIDLFVSKQEKKEKYKILDINSFKMATNEFVLMLVKKVPDNIFQVILEAFEVIWLKKDVNSDNYKTSFGIIQGLLKQFLLIFMAKFKDAGLKKGSEISGQLLDNENYVKVYQFIAEYVKENNVESRLDKNINNFKQKYLNSQEVIKQKVLNNNKEIFKLREELKEKQKALEASQKQIDSMKNLKMDPKGFADMNWDGFFGINKDQDGKKDENEKKDENKNKNKKQVQEVNLNNNNNNNNNQNMNMNMNINNNNNNNNNNSLNDLNQLLDNPFNNFLLNSNKNGFFDRNRSNIFTDVANKNGSMFDIGNVNNNNNNNNVNNNNGNNMNINNNNNNMNNIFSNTSINPSMGIANIVAS